MWSFERIFDDGDAFFDAVTQACRSARRTIDLESYIFQNDPLGMRIADALVEAAQRQIRVRVIVDGIGSAGWASVFGARLHAAGVRYRVFHRLPWDSRERRRPIAQWMLRLPRMFRSLNRRNHRKMILVDGEEAFVGSMNVAAVHLRSLSGDAAWRDVGVLLRGPGCSALAEAFEFTWNRRPWTRRGKRPGFVADPDIRLNSTRKLRRYHYRDLLDRLSNATCRVWVITPYFVPHGALLEALADAARRGVVVRVLVPGISDVFFMPWVTAALMEGLARAGVEMYRFPKRVLHAKLLVIDDWMTIGSSNMNHRSIFHDLEVDAVLSSDKAKSELEAIAEHDFSISERIERSPVGAVRLLLGRFLLVWRNWL